MRNPALHVLLALVLSGLSCGAPAGGPQAGGSPTPAPTAPVASATPPATATLTAAQRTAAISEIQNDVKSRKQANAAYAAAHDGQSLLEGGAVRTGDESRVRIDISDGSLVRIGAQTEFDLVSLSPQVTDPVTKIELFEGELWIRVTKALGLGSLEIETPVGSAGVRGSLMSVTFDPATGRMEVTCLEGLCRLTDPQGRLTDLKAGEFSVILAKGQPPTAAAPMTADQLARWAANFPEAGDVLAKVTPAPTATQAVTVTATFSSAAPGGPTLTPDPALAIAMQTQVAALPEANCKNLKSISGTQTAKITFINHLPQPVYIYWEGYDGKEQLYNKLGAGQSYVQATFITHPWCVRDPATGKALLTITATAATQTATVP